MLMNVSRRRFLATALGAAAGRLNSSLKAAQGGKTRLILLGTAGGPRPRKAASGPAQVILVNDVPYVIDCGDGVARQLVSAGISLPALRHIFITHHHSDHNADYGNLLLLSWAVGLKTRVDTWGPPPLKEITRLFFKMSAYDIRTRMADEGRASPVPLIQVHELRKGGVVMHDVNVKVTATLVPHPEVSPAFAFRFDTADRSIVISGDTAPSDNLVKLAQGADILVHEALYVPAVDRIVASVPNATTLKKHIIDSHTAVEDCGRIAEAAGVKTLVLSHLIPPDDPAVTEQMWIDAVKQHYGGTIVVGKDLMEL